MRMAGNEPRYRLHFDGGSINNPGRGYGSFRLAGPDLKPTVHRVEFGDGVTSNEAEYRALIAGLEALLVHLRRQDQPPDRVRVEVTGDSALVVNQLLGRWRVRSQRLAPLYRKALGLMQEFGEVKVRWQPRAASVRLLGH